jgi:hypothetical protein
MAYELRFVDGNFRLKPIRLKPKRKIKRRIKK